MSGGPEPASGRVRRGRSLLAAVVGLGLLASLPVVFALLGGEGPLPVAGAPGGSAGEGSPPQLEGSLTGRLVYVADDPDRPGRARLWVLDLDDDSVVEGPNVRDVTGVYAAGPVNTWIVLIGRDGSDSIGYLVRSPAANNIEPAEIDRGDVVSLSTDGNLLLVGDANASRSSGCPEPSYTLRQVLLTTFREAPAYLGGLPCGRLVTATLLGPQLPVVSVIRRGRPEVHLLQAGDPRVLFHGLTHLVVSANGSFLLAAAPNGDLRVWPGGGAPRPVVSGSRTIPERIMAWSGDGRYAVVDGAIGSEEGTWLVDTAGGTAAPFPPSGYPLAGELSGATFAPDGTLFAIAAGRILASIGTALFPVSLPSGAPPPVGPVAWLP